MLFEKFGEFDSAEELNRAAAAQLAEGDIDAIYGIAEENGIDREDAEDYIDGAAPELCTPIMAALGKLKVEAAELEPQEIMEDWHFNTSHVSINPNGNQTRSGLFLFQYISCFY